MLGYDNLANYFNTNFSMIYHHHYRLSEIENMIPWEKFVYVDLVKQYVKHMEDLQRDQAAQMKAQRRR